MAPNTEQPTTAAVSQDPVPDSGPDNPPAADQPESVAPTAGDILRTRLVHIALGLLVAAVSGWLLYRSRTELPVYGENGQAGAGYLPALLALCLIGLGLALAVVWGFGPRARNGEAPILTFDRHKIARALGVWLALALYAALLEPLGFTAASEVLMLIIIVVVERMRSIPMIITLLLLPPAFYFLFQELLAVQLPFGTLWY